MKVKPITITISNLDNEQANYFLRFLKTIESWGIVGHCGTFWLTVDGDGTWRPKIEVANIDFYKDIEPIKEEDGIAKLFIE